MLLSSVDLAVILRKYLLVMMIDISKGSSSENYSLLTQTVLPRPIAWILSENEDGSHNLAPFSYFTIVSSAPATLAVSIGMRPDGSAKDTRANLLSRRSCVLHLGSRENAEALNRSSAPLPPGVSEAECLGLELVPFPGSPLPRLAAAKVAFGGHYQQHIEVGRQALILIEVTQAWIDDSCLMNQPGQLLEIDPKGLDALSRLGGDYFCALGEPFALSRPNDQG